MSNSSEACRNESCSATAVEGLAMAAPLGAAGGRHERSPQCGRQVPAKADFDVAGWLSADTVRGIAIIDAGWRIVRINQSFIRITGYGAVESLGRDAGFLFSPTDDAGIHRRIRSSMAARAYWQGEVWSRRSDGSAYPQWLTISRVDGDGMQMHYVASFVDITRHKETQARMLHLAHRDPLTGLANRSLLEERVRHDLARAHRGRESLALMFIDLDRFKSINDRFGHRTGDTVLALFTRSAVHSLRPLDLLGRIGGEEFVALLPGVSTESALAVAERVRSNFALAAADVDGQKVAATVSVGTASAEQSGYDFDALYAVADAALYRAKQKGRNRIEAGGPAPEAVVQQLHVMPARAVAKT